VEQKWLDLSRTLKKTRAYFDQRITPESLAGAYFLRRAVTREIDEAIIAYAALWSSSHPQWRELGTVWVAEEHCGNGVMREMVNELITVRLLPDEEWFFITKDPRVIRIADWYSFKAVTTESRRDLLAWASEVGITTRLPESVYGSGSMSEKRKLFMMRETR
jgi:hypothetical protein